jgi:ketosteroid isomerase-like protein
MADDNAFEVAQKAWDKWVAADLEGFVNTWDPDGVWTNAGRSQISGPRRGHDEITKVAQLAFQLSGGTLKARPVELAAAGEDVVLGYFHVEAQRPGAAIDQYGLQRFVIRSGKIVSLDNVFSDQGQFDAFYE